MNVEVNGRRLRELRKEKAIERKELEELSGVHWTTIARIELDHTRTHRLSTVKKLADALSVKPTEFAGGEVLNATKSSS